MNKLRCALIITAFLFAGCTNHLKVPANDSRASLSPQFLSDESATTLGSEEMSPTIRETVLEAVRMDLLRTGRYPKLAIQNSELLSLVQTPPNQITGNSRWNYKALVRINLERTSHDVGFMAFERNDEIIVRKIST